MQAASVGGAGLTMNRRIGRGPLISAATLLEERQSPRRFPPPWTVEELDACDSSTEQKFAYVYFKMSQEGRVLSLEENNYARNDHAAAS
jgi:hypothetical protein